MNVGLFLGHPAHFHMLKNVATQLHSNGHAIFFVIKKKDILEDLMREAGFEYTKIREDRGNTKWAQIKSVLTMEWNMIKFIRKNKIDILMGSTLTFAARVLCGRPVVSCGEDDAYIVPRITHITMPFVSAHLTPITCNCGKWENKAIHYPGFQKLAYLHPKRFTPKAEMLKQYHIDPKKPYFLIRFAKLNAHHDTGVQGISTEVAQHIIDLLAPHGQIYITSERELEPQFEQYRLHINPLDIHHVMAFATIYIGDSQSMAVEAAMLGVPSLRFNDFVGAKKIGVMEELEHVYGLTYGISTHDPEKLYAKIQELLGIDGAHSGIDGAHFGGARGSFEGSTGLKSEFQARRERMLAEKIDVTAFFTWLIENYPQSAQEAKEGKDDARFWQQFK